MPIILVAECGSMHEGNRDLACEMIRLAKAAGCDIAKFQFGHDPADRLRRIPPSFAEHIKRYADCIGIELMASIFSQDGLNLAREIGMPRYKIAHQVNMGAPEQILVRDILSDGKETFVSGFPIRKEPNARGIWVVPKYPAYPWEIGMPDRFIATGWYGYSDHSHGPAACLVAAARNAQYIEKHFTLNKASQTIRDNAFSASPEEMAELVCNARQINALVEANDA